MTFDSIIPAQVLYQDQSIVELIGDVICPNKKSRGEKSVYITSFEEINRSTYQYKQCKAFNIPFKDQKPCVTLFGGTYCFRKKTKLDYQKEKLSPLMQQCINQNSPRQKQRKLIMNLLQKKKRYYHKWNNSVTLLLAVLLQHKFTFLFTFQTFLQLTTRSFTINTM